MIAALVNGKLTRAEHGKPATCPECAGDLYARLPAHAIRHWAHKPLPDGQTRNCTRNSEGMTEWHRAWQNERTDLDCIEVRGEGFIADTQNAAGHTIEFQHSRIHEDEIKAREQYWRKGCWVADGLPEGHEHIRLERLPGKNYTDDFWLFRWAPMPKLIYLAKWPVWVDVGERGILQVKFAKQGRGGGWLVTRQWFIDEIVNGTKIVLHTHAITSASVKPQNRTNFAARVEKDEDLSDLPVYCPRPNFEMLEEWDTPGFNEVEMQNTKRVAFEHWLRTKPGRCQHCGYHIETQGHGPTCRQAPHSRQRSS